MSAQCAYYVEYGIYLNKHTEICIKTKTLDEFVLFASDWDDAQVLWWEWIESASVLLSGARTRQGHR